MTPREFAKLKKQLVAAADHAVTTTFSDLKAGKFRSTHEAVQQIRQMSSDQLAGSKEFKKFIQEKAK